MTIKDFYLCSYYMQFLNHGKNNLSDAKENIHSLVFQDYHLIRKHHMYFLERLISKKIYNFIISQKNEKTSSRLYYQKKFNNSNLDWKNI